MGMFSEIAAAGQAERLERVLRIAMKNRSKAVWTFVRKNILPLYCDEAGDSWGSYEIPDDIKKAFKLK